MPTDITLAKKPHQKTRMTLDQMVEFARCIDPVTGPAYFMSNYFYIQHPTQGKLKYQPYEYQERLIDIYHNYRFSISLMPRQTGKCLKGDTSFINIKNKHTGEIKSVSLDEFYEMQNAARKNNQV